MPRLLTLLLALGLTTACGDDAAENANSTNAANNANSANSSNSTNSTNAANSANSANSSNSANSANSSNSTNSTNSANSANSANSTNNGTGMLPPIPETHGVVYVGHLESTNIRMYRTDGTSLSAAGSFDVGGPVLDLTINRDEDVLYATHPADDEVSIWQLNTPSGDAVATPTEVSRVSFERVVLTLAVDEIHDRLYVAEALPAPMNGDPQPDMTLHIIDVSDPTSPQKLTTAVVPSTASWDVDPARQIAFFHNESADALHGYSVAGDEVTSLGTPVALTGSAWYPEENNYGFQARNLTVDPFTNRLYAGRPMGTLSELIAVEYPPAIPAAGNTYSGTMGELTKVADAFDLQLEPGDRPNLLDAFQPVVDPNLDMVFLSASAWNGTQASAIMVNYAAGDIATLATGCDDFEGFGCFFRPFFDGNPSGYSVTDGAACADWTNGVIVGTSYDPNENANPGYIHAFSYDSEGNMVPFNDVDGDTLTTDGYPVAIVCH